ncbi:pirin family protein [Mycobacterium vicinigordonae]|uniref:Pirin family protein n=1 Tax=Mycobacterium vicinigordonae TaxID=1719132 RepID=A0A7D6E0B6_9MYCO|nr:pirin family protein [Mycobacterium vicinigordonae]QLL07850.1 pirin family protein [Mycobacterium vicinigordonae]
MPVDIRRAADRAVTTTDWLQSRHSFSFGDHYDPHDTHFGLLLVNNDDIVAAGTGFATHQHRDMEILTWVLEGELTHQDSTGTRGVIYPGLAQRMSAGSGILHSETNDSTTQAVHFIQMWVIPDEAPITPSYQQDEVDNQLANVGLVTVASGIPGRDGALTLHNRAAALHVARLRAGDTITLPDAPYLHVFVARGDTRLEDGPELTGGDAARLTDSGGRRLNAEHTAEVLVWEMHAKLGG